MYAYAYMSVCVSVCLSVCMYIYIHMHTISHHFALTTGGSVLPTLAFLEIVQEGREAIRIIFLHLPSTQRRCSKGYRKINWMTRVEKIS